MYGPCRRSYQWKQNVSAVTAKEDYALGINITATRYLIRCKLLTRRVLQLLKLGVLYGW